MGGRDDPAGADEGTAADVHEPLVARDLDADQPGPRARQRVGAPDDAHGPTVAGGQRASPTYATGGREHL